ncbi:MAG: sulfotransferase [Acidobacteriota bacterium]|nr:sulfotransferase [Acidobacteriota bacterium]
MQIIHDELEAKVESPIVIVGCQRSGTTLLRTMLERHPGLLVHPYEPQFFLDLARRHGDEIRDPRAAAAFLRNHPYRAETVSAEAIDAAYDAAGRMSLREFAQRYLRLWAGDHARGRRLVLKHPYLVHHLDLVYELFPQATVVHIVRDPRGNVSSTRARWRKVSVWESAMLWRTAVSTGHALAVKQPRRCVELRYEDLVREPEPTMSRLCADLGIPFSPRLLQFEMATWSYAPGEGGKKVQYRGPDPSRLGLWRRYLSPVDVRIIETCCGEQMDLWGYDRTDPAVSGTAFAFRVGMQRLYYGVRRAARRVRRITWKRG